LFLLHTVKKVFFRLPRILFQCGEFKFPDVSSPLSKILTRPRPRNLLDEDNNVNLSGIGGLNSTTSQRSPESVLRKAAAAASYYGGQQQHRAYTSGDGGSPTLDEVFLMSNSGGNAYNASGGHHSHHHQVRNLPNLTLSVF
jgi:hypothetical protein